MSTYKKRHGIRIHTGGVNHISHKESHAPKVLDPQPVRPARKVKPKKEAA